MNNISCTNNKINDINIYTFLWVKRSCLLFKNPIILAKFVHIIFIKYYVMYHKSVEEAQIKYFTFVIVPTSINNIFYISFNPRALFFSTCYCLNTHTQCNIHILWIYVHTCGSILIYINVWTYTLLYKTKDYMDKAPKTTMLNSYNK